MPAVLLEALVAEKYQIPPWEVDLSEPSRRDIALRHLAALSLNERHKPQK